VNLFTFGSPQVGSDKFATAFEKAKIPTLRFVNAEKKEVDPVTIMLPRCKHNIEQCLSNQMELTRSIN
jgi:hypothetical protein